MRELKLPETISTSFQGTAQSFQDSVAGMGVLLLLAIFVIYLVLGILYESFIHPLTILSGLPTAVFGALLTIILIWASAANLMQGVKIAFVTGLLFFLAIDLTMYATMNIQNLKATLVDPLIGGFLFACAGAAIMAVTQGRK